MGVIVVLRRFANDGNERVDDQTVAMTETAGRWVRRLVLWRSDQELDRAAGTRWEGDHVTPFVGGSQVATPQLTHTFAGGTAQG